jgi:type I restriction enzyme S subunit
MTNKMKNVPELRFPEFIEEWEEKRLGDLYKYQQGQQIPVENQYKIQINNMKRFIRIVDVTENPKKRYIKDRKESGLINQKDLIMIRYGASAGTISMGYEGVIANNLFKFVKKQNVDNRYFYFLLKKSHFKIKSLSSQSAMPALNFNAMDTLKFSIPQYSEQQKIGSFFSKLDRQIELEEQKLAKLEEQKKGYMQQIFSQEFRFKDENGNDYPEWEDKLISDIGKVVTGNTPSKKDNDYWNSNQYVWVTPTDISNKKNIYTSGYQLSQKGFSKARQLPKNTLLITCIASIGKNAILRIEGSCNQQINAVIPNDNYDVDYLYYAFEDVSKLMKSIAGKTATQIVNKAVFEKLLLNVPIYEEQQKISGFLNKVDILIDKQTQKIDELKLRKQGFLQKMFV